MNQHSMSKGEKYFWITIIILMLCYISLHFIASINITNQGTFEKVQHKKGKPVLYEVILSDTTKRNLQLAEPLLSQNMKKELKDINMQLDKSFDQIFLDIKNNNLEKFLDFHYSVIGEYVELGAMATGKIEKTIQEKLLGTDFSQKIIGVASEMDNHYTQAIKRHTLLIEEQAYQNVDTNLNSEAISLLNNEINKNIPQQGGKIGVLISAGLAKKVIGTISAKLAAKATGKIAFKTGMKLTAKTANAVIGASAGSICGPAIIICSPVLAITAWFATDAIITTGDEFLNREQFKSEIMSSLNAQNKVLKTEYKELYSQSFARFSEQTKKQISELETKEKVRIKDKIFAEDDDF